MSTPSPCHAYFSIDRRSKYLITQISVLQLCKHSKDLKKIGVDWKIRCATVTKHLAVVLLSVNILIRIHIDTKVRAASIEKKLRPIARLFCIFHLLDHKKFDVMEGSFIFTLSRNFHWFCMIISIGSDRFHFFSFSILSTFRAYLLNENYELYLVYKIHPISSHFTSNVCFQSLRDFISTNILIIYWSDSVFFFPCRFSDFMTDCQSFCIHDNIEPY